MDAHQRYLGFKGGRSSGKSHRFAEKLVERMVSDPNLQWACLREVQKSLKFSAKKLIVDKIHSLGVSHLFHILNDEIRHRSGKGVVIFQGLQDHTADSVKSLEGFDGIWAEEANSLSARSIEILDPTIRKEGSQLWFSWNPEEDADAVEQLFRDTGIDTSYRDDTTPQYGNDSLAIHINYMDNPWLPKVSLAQAIKARSIDPEKYEHVWLGGYNVKSDSQVFAGRWVVQEFEPGPSWDGPYYGLDFGFSTDPTAAVECWRNDSKLHVRRACGRRDLDLDDTAEYIENRIPGFVEEVVQADSARPESISHLKKSKDPGKAIPRIRAVVKWPGSVKDGIEWIKSHDQIIIHPDAEPVAKEARMYRYKVNKAGEVLSEVVDKNNHYWDAIRYAFSKLIKSSRKRARVA